MQNNLRTVYLLADSQLLFSSSNGSQLLYPALKYYANYDIRAAYIGVSNGDNPTFYELFLGAMQLLGISNCMQITTAFPQEQQEFLQNSQIVVLSGGDVFAGFEIMYSNGITDTLIKNYYNGSTIVGISAGAVQMGLIAHEKEFSGALLQIVPLVISVHEEQDDWKQLKETVQSSETYTGGIGIPLGGAVLYYPDQSLEAIGKPALEIKKINNQLKQNILLPKETGN